MGYNQYIYGNITIEPKLTGEIKEVIKTLFDSDYTNEEDRDKELDMIFQKFPCGHENIRDCMIDDSYPYFLLANDNTIEQTENDKVEYPYEVLVYIVENLLAPNGYKCVGDFEWMGEERDDNHWITIDDNQVYLRYGKIKYEDLGMIKLQKIYGAY